MAGNKLGNYGFGTPQESACAASARRFYERICARAGEAALRLHLMELYRVIQRSMDATGATQDQELNVLLAGLEYEARLYQQEIEGPLGVRN